MRRASILLVLFATVCGTSLLAQTPTTSGPERGTLVLDGGGATFVSGSANGRAVMQKFAQLAGGPGARIVVIPTAWRDDLLTPEALKQLLPARARELMGVERVTVMHTRDRKQADSEEFVTPLRQATGVWIPGGKDAYLIDAYVGTRVETEIKALLARGGVVGGTSAGAATLGSLDLYDEGPAVDSAETSSGKTPRVHATRPCLELLTNSTIVPHWSKRNRPDLTPVLASHPGLLGIGIDEDAAAVIQGHRLEVFGDGHVGIYDGKVHGDNSYYDLSSEDRFDLHLRAPAPAG